MDSAAHVRIHAHIHTFVCAYTTYLWRPLLYTTGLLVKCECVWRVLQVLRLHALGALGGGVGPVGWPEGEGVARPFGLEGERATSSKAAQSFPTRSAGKEAEPAGLDEDEGQGRPRGRDGLRGIAMAGGAERGGQGGRSSGGAAAGSYSYSSDDDFVFEAEAFAGDGLSRGDDDPDLQRDLQRAIEASLRDQNCDKNASGRAAWRKKRAIMAQGATQAIAAPKRKIMLDAYNRFRVEGTG